MKYTLAISLCILSISTFAQNVPNGGFENWETEGGVYLEYFQASFMIREIKQKVEVC